MGGRGKSSGVQHQLSIHEQLVRTEVSSIIDSRNLTIGVDKAHSLNKLTSDGIENNGNYIGNRACVCCGTFSIPYSSDSFVCPVCGWIDDVFQNTNPDSTIGPNECSLNQMKVIIKIRNGT